MKLKAALVFVVLVAVLVAGVWITLARSGGFGTRAEPTAIERIAARVARRAAVPRDARNARNPVMFSPEVWLAGRSHFADHCASCHSNDGSGRTELGQNLYPKAPDMRLAETQQLTDGELYWIIANGVRLTGMPAWGTGRSDDEDTWKLVHFVRHLKDLNEDQLRDMKALNPRTPAEFEEERQDRLFLEGKDPETVTPTTPHHHQE